MTRTLAEVAASSTAHGIGKAASAQRTSVRVMWVLLFLIFLALFLKSGFNQVKKLKDRRLIKEYHAENVPFLFPDLYFCPSNPYSGSYPYSLSKPDADLINTEISRIERKIDDLQSAVVTAYNRSGRRYPGQDSLQKLEIIQASLPFTLIANNLVQRKEQSVLASRVTQNSNWRKMSIVKLKTFYLPGYLVCFKFDPTPDQKRMLQFSNSTLEIWLSTDPYFPEINFTGYPINHVTAPESPSFPFQNWHPIYNTEFMRQSGYNMLIVPPGAYPLLEFETGLQIGPGNAYSVKLEMVENSFNAELHGTHCIVDPPEVAFENPLTTERELFSYSSAACHMQRRLRSVIKRAGCRFSRYPMLWEHRFTPRCNNASEMTPASYSNMLFVAYSETDEYEMETDAYCKSRIPCKYPKYSAVASVGKWPSVSRSSAEDLSFLGGVFSSESERPGFHKLVKIARQLLNGSHSAHLEGLFRMYMSESWLKVQISAASAMSDQGVWAWSYTVTDFLADTGGLLGLYIGCSLLTLCELFEMLYILTEHACKLGSKTKDTTGEVEDNPKDAASAVDAEQQYYPTNQEVQ